jgi:hypothetical protein
MMTYVLAAVAAAPRDGGARFGLGILRRRTENVTK